MKRVHFEKGILDECWLLMLPTDVVTKVLGQLDPHDIARIDTCSKKMQTATAEVVLQNGLADGITGGVQVVCHANVMYQRAAAQLKSIWPRRHQHRRFTGELDEPLNFNPIYSPLADVLADAQRLQALVPLSIHVAFSIRVALLRVHILRGMVKVTKNATNRRNRREDVMAIVNEINKDGNKSGGKTLHSAVQRFEHDTGIMLRISDGPA